VLVRYCSCFIIAAFRPYELQRSSYSKAAPGCFRTGTIVRAAGERDEFASQKRPNWEWASR